MWPLPHSGNIGPAKPNGRQAEIPSRRGRSRGKGQASATAKGKIRQQNEGQRPNCAMNRKERHHRGDRKRRRPGTSNRRPEPAVAESIEAQLQRQRMQQQQDEGETEPNESNAAGSPQPPVMGDYRYDPKRQAYFHFSQIEDSSDDDDDDGCQTCSPGQQRCERCQRTLANDQKTGQATPVAIVGGSQHGRRILARWNAVRWTRSQLGSDVGNGRFCHRLGLQFGSILLLGGASSTKSRGSKRPCGWQGGGSARGQEQVGLHREG
mmetsp:Transcript_18710/g.51215  ORF Transcript_18710/g.51215 Transcript_18710/m.51215 type:complete len:265 (+) Transcript_18710:587-1381(+)